MVARLFIGNLAWDTTTEDLVQIFAFYGEVLSAKVVVDPMTGKSRGFGFVEMTNCEVALQNLNNFMHEGREWRVNIALREEDRPRRHLSDSKIIPVAVEHFKETPIVQISDEISIKFIEYLKNNPDELYKISPRKFEELVAELFDGMGYKVELTKQTRDGGKDLIVSNKNGFDFVYYVECKRFNKDTPVSIDVVRSLHSTIITDKVNKGIVATTSSFTRDAKLYISSLGKLLDGYEMDGIVSWMNIYTEKH